MTKKARLVPPDVVPTIWSEVQPLIDKALTRSDEAYNSEDYLNLLLSEECMLWLGIEDDEIKIILICEVVEYPRTKILQIHIMATKSGHDFESWRSYLNSVEDFGRDNGCTLIEVTVPKGLARTLKWEHNYSVLTKHI